MELQKDPIKFGDDNWLPSKEELSTWIQFNPVPSFRQYQEKTIAAIIKGWESGKRFAIVEAPTGCHAKGTKILMFDGSLKNVEDIEVGDLLMGSDSTPRRVLDLHRGRQEMTRIIPTKGDPFVVNLDHILSLQRTNTESSPYVKRRKDYKGKNPIIAISVREWLTQSKTFKHTYKLYRTGVTFPNQDFKFTIPPYILGVWLGNGTSKVAAITNLPNEVADAWEQFAEDTGCKITLMEKKDCLASTHLIVRKKISDTPLNPALSLFRELNLLDNKHIPFTYLISSRQDRLHLLAGLIDTDGFLDRGCFGIVQKRKNLADSITFVARSLGFAAYMTETRKKSQNGTWGVYYNVSISGDVSEIPTKVSHKKAGKRQQIKSVTRTGFKVEMLPEDDFFGFTVDKDNLYLMGDFTVTHNSGKSIYSLVLGRLFKRTFLCTPQKMLQNQYMNDFGEHLYELKGRSTYPCLRVNYELWNDRVPYENVDYITLETSETLPEDHPWRKYTCANAPCLSLSKGADIRKECKTKGICEYIKRRDTALIFAPFSLLNFSNMILFTRLMPNVYEKRPLLIMDEAHSIETFLYEFATITITPKVLKPLHIHMDKEEDLYRVLKPFQSMEEMVEYIEQILIPAYEKFKESKSVITTDDDEDDGDGEIDPKDEKKRLVKLIDKLEAFVKDKPTDHSHVLVPVMDLEAGEMVTTGLKIKPFSVAHLSNLAFGSSNSRVLLMSATILDPNTFCKSVGIKKEDAFFIQVPSTFPAKNRKIFLDTTVGSMAYRHKDKTLPKMLNKILLLSEKHRDHKGIIHTGNYANMFQFKKWVRDYPELERRILFQAQKTFAEKELILRSHAESSEPTIICGPGFLEGLDLKDDLARFNIIMKLPYMSLADPLVKRKAEEFPEWYDLQVALAIIQAIGRTVRSPTDWSLIYILDYLGKVFYEDNKDTLFPKYIQDAVVFI